MSRRKRFAATHSTSERIVFGIRTSWTVGINGPTHMRRRFATNKQSTRIGQMCDIDDDGVKTLRLPFGELTASTLEKFVTIAGRLFDCACKSLVQGANEVIHDECGDRLEQSSPHDALQYVGATRVRK